MQSKEEIAEVKEQEKAETLKKTKRIVYPMYAIGFTFLSIVWFGQRQQQRLIEVNTKKLSLLQKFRDQYHS